MPNAPTDDIPELGEDRKLAQTRLQFLTAGDFDTRAVRDAILASWWRSREFNVPADRIDLPYCRDRDLDSPLIRGAQPVLERLADQLDGQPISLILTDASGVVLTQRTGDSDLHRHLEHVELAPGFSYGERYVGTNGIGTTLEDGKPQFVFGHEHYAENLEDLACAGMPIHHPISGKLIGAVDLTCWRKDAGRLLVALALSTGEQIRQALLNHTNMRELTLFNDYLKACRRTTGIVVAFSDDLVMMNDAGNQLLDPADRSVLLEHARGAMSTADAVTETVVLTSGNRARMRFRRVTGPRGRTAGGVVTVHLVEADDASTSMPPQFVPGLVGSTPHWLRCCRKVDLSYAAGEWLAIAGERGSGRCAVATRVHQRRNPVQRLHAVDAARAGEDGWLERVRQDLDSGLGAMIVRNVDELSAHDAAALADELRAAAAAGAAPWMAVTMSAESEGDPALVPLLALFPRTVEVPPLRHHADDLRELVPLFLSRISKGKLTCTPAAMHLLMRASWPGNVTELYDVLRQVFHKRRAGAVEPSDLPAELHTAARRPLNRLESMERDAIVQSLEDAGGNKAKAAELLGISRATVYRRIHNYGIVVPRQRTSAH